MDSQQRISSWYFILLLMLVWPLLLGWNLKQAAELDDFKHQATESEHLALFANLSRPHTFESLEPLQLNQINIDTCSSVRDLSLPEISQIPFSQGSLGHQLHAVKKILKTNFGLKHPPISFLWFLVLGILFSLLSRNRESSSFRVASISSGFISLSIFFAWASLDYVDRQQPQIANMDEHLSMTGALASTFKVFNGWAFRNNEPERIHTNKVKLAIVTAIEQNYYDHAVNFSRHSEDQSTESARQLAYLSAARHKFLEQKLQRALYLAEKSHALRGNQLANDYVNASRSANVIKAVSDGGYERALELLEGVNRDWQPEFVNRLWTSVAQSHLRSLARGSIDKNPNATGMENAEFLNTAANVISAYIKSSNHPANKSTTNEFLCLYVGFVQEKGRLEIENSNSQKAVETLTITEMVASHAPKAKELLSIAYHNEGIRYYEAGATENAIQSLTSAVERNKKDENLSCSLSIALMENAVTKAYALDFEKAESDMDQAIQLCQYDGIGESIASIAMTTGASHMRYSRWRQAKQSYNLVLENGTPEQKKQGQAFLNDLAQNGPMRRQSKIEEARKWVEGIPRISGSICGGINDDGSCSEIHLYKDDKLIGRSTPGMSESHIEVGDELLVLKDSFANGRIDTAELSEGNQRRVLVEKDGDFRLDRELIFNGRGDPIMDEKYSGRIMLRVPDGVIGETRDIFTSSDSYLQVRQNNEYLGHTDVALNSQFPVFKQGLSIDYRRGDVITITMLDDDSGNFVDDVGSAIANFFNRPDIAEELDDEDDLIDYFSFNRLPESQRMVGSLRQAAITVHVTPTDLPPGIYDIKDPEYVNTFRSANRSEIRIKEISDLKQQAHLTEKRSEEIAQLAALIVPEASNRTLFHQTNFVSQLILSVIGEKIIHESLKNHENKTVPRSESRLVEPN